MILRGRAYFIGFDSLLRCHAPLIGAAFRFADLLPQDICPTLQCVDVAPLAAAPLCTPGKQMSRKG